MLGCYSLLDHSVVLSLSEQASKVFLTFLSPHSRILISTRRGIKWLAFIPFWTILGYYHCQNKHQRLFRHFCLHIPESLSLSEQRLNAWLLFPSGPIWGVIILRLSIKCFVGICVSTFLSMLEQTLNAWLLLSFLGFLGSYLCQHRHQMLGWHLCFHIPVSLSLQEQALNIWLLFPSWPSLVLIFISS